MRHAVIEERRARRVDLVRVHSHDSNLVILALDRPGYVDTPSQCVSGQPELCSQSSLTTRCALPASIAGAQSVETREATELSWAFRTRLGLADARDVAL